MGLAPLTAVGAEPGTSPQQSALSSPLTIVLKAGTPVQLRLAETLDTRKGEQVEGVEF